MVLRAGYNPNLRFVAGSFSVSHSFRQSRTPRALSLDMATVDAGRLLANAKKRRGVARASLTRLGNRIKDLEGGDTEPKTLELAQRMSQKLSDLDTEFRTHHHALVDLIDDEETLAREQETLDAHDDLVAELAVRVKQVIAASSPSSNESSRRIASRKLTHLQKSLTSIIPLSATHRLPFLIRVYSVNTRKGRTTSTAISSRLVTTCIGWNSLMTTNSSSLRIH